MASKWRMVCLIAIVALGTLTVVAQEATSPTPRVIEMTAANYAFAPFSVHVKVGENIRLMITATDKEHGIKIKSVAEGSAAGTAVGLEVTPQTNCVKFKKDETATLEFIARFPGTYEFECCKLCGFGHGKMKGEIVVDP
jgi:heme/copper-type cytochrome/quinol oxidase subunit 2